MRVFEIYEKMFQLLCNSLKKHHHASVVEKMDEEGNVDFKNVREILEVNPKCDDTKLDKKALFVGAECTKLIKQLGLTPSSKQLDWFHDKVFLYYQTVSQYLLKYFRKA